MPGRTPFGWSRSVTVLVRRILRGPAVIALLAGTALVLGYFGFREINGDLNVGDAAYRSLQLFNIDAQVPPGEIPWQLQVARFLAPFAIVYAALAAGFALAREQVQRAQTRVLARRHVVIIGLGAKGSVLARRLREDGTYVVVIERDAANGASRGLRDSGVPVLVGDARDAAVLRTARVDRATHVTVLAGDDSTNLEILAAVQRMTDPDRPVAVHVEVESPPLWADLHRVPLRHQAAHRRVEFVSIPDREARCLMESAVPLLEQDEDALETIAAGRGPTVERLIVHLARMAADGPERSRIQVVGQDAADRVEGARSSDPWIAERVALEGRSALTDDAPKSLGFVCGLQEAEALAAAAALGRHGIRQTVVAVPSRETEAVLMETGFDLSGVLLVPVEEMVLSAGLIVGSSTELIARAKHEDYREQLAARGDTVDTNRSLVEWDQLEESLKESNRRFADGVAEHLDALGAELAPLSAHRPAPLNVPSDVLEAMAKDEHDRWVRDLRRDGWRPTTGPKDPKQLLHPLLVDWSDLNEEQREKDRDAIRALPELLAQVGYEIRLRSEVR